MQFFKKTALLILLLGFIHLNYGQSFNLSEKAKISVLTCGKGNELYSIYGHTALRISDPERMIDVVYNYGAFDFRTSNFYGKFVKGDLQYFVDTSTFEQFLYAYVNDNRSIYEQELNLSQDQKQQIFNELGNVLSSEKRFYTYKFIDRNCTTMVVDLVNSVLNEKISTKIPDTQKPYRKILYDYQIDKFYENLGINLIFGSKVDNQSDKIFLPDEFLQGIENTSINGKKLSEKTVTVFEAQNNEETKSWWNSYYSFLIAMLLLAFGAYKSRKTAVIYLFLTGALGAFFSVVGCYSLHKEVLWNYNVMVLNPLYLPLLFLAWKNNVIWTKRLSFICYAMIAVYIVYMLNKAHLFMMLPFIAVSLISLWKISKK